MGYTTSSYETTKHKQTQDDSKHRSTLEVTCPDKFDWSYGKVNKYIAGTKPKGISNSKDFGRKTDKKFKINSITKLTLEKIYKEERFPSKTVIQGVYVQHSVPVKVIVEWFKARRITDQKFIANEKQTYICSMTPHLVSQFQNNKHHLSYKL